MFLAAANRSRMFARHPRPRTSRKKNSVQRGSFAAVLRAIDEKIVELIRPFGWWRATLAGFGAVAFVTVLVALFLPFGKGPSLLRTTATVPPVQSPEFLRTLSTF